MTDSFSSLQNSLPDHLVLSKVQRINERYNPENDVIPGVPLVTITDFELLQLVESLLTRYAQLQKRVVTLEGIIATQMNPFRWRQP